MELHVRARKGRLIALLEGAIHGSKHRRELCLIGRRRVPRGMLYGQSLQAESNFVELAEVPFCQLDDVPAIRGSADDEPFLFQLLQGFANRETAYL
jgi:hypothetical protein